MLAGEPYPSIECALCEYTETIFDRQERGKTRRGKKDVCICIHVPSTPLAKLVDCLYIRGLCGKTTEFLQGWDDTIGWYKGFSGYDGIFVCPGLA